MKNLAYYNGKYAPLEELTVPALDRAVYFGDGVYEAAVFVGGVPFGMGDHLARFERSMGFVKIAKPMELDEVDAVVRELCRQVGGEGIVYWQATRGTAPRTHTFPENVPSNLLAWAKSKPIGDVSKKLTLITQPDIRYKMCNVKTLNLMPNVMASQAAKDAGCDEAVFVRDGYVTEGSHTNMHIIKEGKLITHPNCELILPGTVRKQMLELCAKLGIEVIERPFTVDEMKDADEVLITSSTSFIRSASTLDGAPIGGRAADVVERLLSAYIEWVERETGNKIK